MNNEPTKQKNYRKLTKKNSIIASFVILCAIVTVLPLGLNLPIFSDLFNPVVVVQEYVDNSQYVINLIKDFNSGTRTMYVSSILLTSRVASYKAMYFVLQGIDSNTIVAKKYVLKHEIDSGVISFDVDIEKSTEVCLKMYCYLNENETLSNCYKIENSYGTGYLIYKSDNFMLNV